MKPHKCDQDVVDGRDLPDLVKLLLETLFFYMWHALIRQIQSASMGSAVAPILCRLVANTTELILLKSFRECLLTAGLNRAFLVSSLNRHTTGDKCV